MVLEWTEENNQVFSAQIDFDLRSINSSTTVIVTVEVPYNAKKVWLSAIRRKDEKNIQFANRSDFNKKLYLGQINEG